LLVLPDLHRLHGAAVRLLIGMLYGGATILLSVPLLSTWLRMSIESP
jgi:hypothetical protein